MRHTVSTELLQEIINYLANRPYAEVAALISSLQEDAHVISEEKTEEQKSADQ